MLDTCHQSFCTCCCAIVDAQTKPPVTWCRDIGRQGSASNLEKFLPKDVQFMKIIVHSVQKCLLRRASPLVFGLGPRGCWHCLKRSCWAGGYIAILGHHTVSLLCTTSSAGSRRGFCVLCSQMGIFRCPLSADCMATALLHGEHR